MLTSLLALALLTGAPDAGTFTSPSGENLRVYHSAAELPDSLRDKFPDVDFSVSALVGPAWVADGYPFYVSKPSATMQVLRGTLFIRVGPDRCPSGIAPKRERHPKVDDQRPPEPPIPEFYVVPASTRTVTFTDKLPRDPSVCPKVD